MKNEIIRLLMSDLEAWQSDAGNYTMKHDSGLVMWVGSGFWFFHPYLFESKYNPNFNLWQRWKLWKYLHEVGAAKLLNKLKEN